MSEIIYTQDTGTKGWISNPRINLYHKLGFTDEQIKTWCDYFKYHGYIYEILTCENDRELFEKYPMTWKFVRSMLLDKSQRRLGRTCFETAKDLLWDGFITDIIYLGLTKQCPDIIISKNNQDTKLSLLPNATHEPDFIINGRLVEMKQNKDSTRWSSSTITVRPGDNGKELQSLFNYSKYNTDDSPLYFLRINYDKNILTIVKYNDFKPSKIKYGNECNDGSYYVHYTPFYFENDIKDFINTLGNAIRTIIK